MNPLKELIRDPSLRQLMAHHAVHVETLDPETARRVKFLAPDDEFIISQYLLGMQYFKDRITSVFGPGNIFLDVGCGAGNWTISSAPLFRHAIGIDIHEKRLSIAKQMANNLLSSHNILLVNSSAGKLPFRDASICAILCNNVMTFLNMPHESFLLELHRVAGNSCKLYLTLTDSGYLMWLFVQLLRRPTLRRFLSLGQVIAKNILFLLRFRVQPYAWANKTYIISLLAKCGWKLCYFGEEGSITSRIRCPIFKKTYFGLPFMKEYILEKTNTD